MLTLDAPYDAHAGALGPQASLPASASDGALGGAHKTPNVYINGLPPHFREDQLYVRPDRAVRRDPQRAHVHVFCWGISFY